MSHSFYDVTECLWRHLTWRLFYAHSVYDVTQFSLSVCDVIQCNVTMCLWRHLVSMTSLSVHDVTKCSVTMCLWRHLASVTSADRVSLLSLLSVYQRHYLWRHEAAVTCLSRVCLWRHISLLSSLCFTDSVWHSLFLPVTSPCWRSSCPSMTSYLTLAHCLFYKVGTGWAVRAVMIVTVWMLRAGCVPVRGAGGWGWR